MNLRVSSSFKKLGDRGTASFNVVVKENRARTRPSCNGRNFNCSWKSSSFAPAKQAHIVIKEKRSITGFISSNLLKELRMLGHCQ